MFYNLTVKEVTRETPNAVSVSFEMNDYVKENFKYTQGQYLTFKKTIDGEELRRSYSLSSSPVVDDDLRVCVKQIEGGKFSSYVNNELKAGDVLESMAPMGGFFTEVNEHQKKEYVLFAAGSGITPIISIIKTVLAVEKESKVTLIYGNKNIASTIYKAELDELKQNHADRFDLQYLMSRSITDANHKSGRISGESCELIHQELQDLYNADEYFLCGPEAMINNLSKHLENHNVAAKKIHFELFTSPVKTTETKVNKNLEIQSQVKIIMDDEEFEFELSSKGDSILDAAIEAGVDAPFSCKGAVCCTCKGKVIEGSASMDMNYALDDDEVEEGYILTCQAHPTSERIVVDYDVI